MIRQPAAADGQAKQCGHQQRTKLVADHLSATILPNRQPKMASNKRMGFTQLLFFCLCIFHVLPTFVARMEVLKDESTEKSANGTSGSRRLMASKTAKSPALVHEEVPVGDGVQLSASLDRAPVSRAQFVNVQTTLKEVPLPDAEVHLRTSIRKVEIMTEPKKAKRATNPSSTHSLVKREASAEEAAAVEEEESAGGTKRLVESVVDEVVDEETETNKKPARKTFSKQGTTAAKAGGGETAKEKTGGADKDKVEDKAAAKKGEPATAAAAKKAGGTNSSATSSSSAPSVAKGGQKEKEKEGKASAGQQKPPSSPAAATATGSSTSSSGPSPSTDSKAAPKEKPPAAQMPQGPPMPPPGAVPSPQIPQIAQPAPSKPEPSGEKPAAPGSSEQSARPSGIGKTPNYKLIYFDARGICEPIRLLFHYARVPFDDVRISRKQWLALKDSTVYGKVPILEVDGKPLTYCHTIARYLARQFGMAGRDSWEQAKVDEISDFHADVAMDLQPYMYVVAGFHQGDKHTLRQAIFLPNVEKHFPVYVNLLKLSGSGFFMPSGITWVDFVIAEYMTTVRHFEPQILDKYPAITKFVRKVQTQPQIFEYVTNREHQPV